MRPSTLSSTRLPSILLAGLLCWAACLTAACDGDSGLALQTDAAVSASDLAQGGTTDLATQLAALEKGVMCDGTRCATGQLCCGQDKNHVCSTIGSAACFSGESFACDGPEDCAVGEVCQGDGQADPGYAPSTTHCVAAASSINATVCRSSADCASTHECIPVTPTGALPIAKLICGVGAHGTPGQVRCEGNTQGGICANVSGAEVCCPFDSGMLCVGATDAPTACAWSGAQKPAIACDDSSDCDATSDCCLEPSPAGKIFNSACKPKGTCGSYKGCHNANDCAGGVPCSPIPTDTWISRCAQP